MRNSPGAGPRRAGTVGAMRSAGFRLGDHTWTDLEAAPTPPLLLVPVGSTEQHGPHLPLDTDLRIAEALALRAAVRLRDGETDHQARHGTDADAAADGVAPPSVLVAPGLTVTASGEHAGFPGTLSIGTTVLTDVVVELARSADWSGGLVFVNGHGGNHEAMTRALATIEDEGRRAHAWWPRVRGADPHAGRTETSLMLALFPETVRRADAASGPVVPWARLRDQGVRAVSPSGVLGDPDGASTEEGRRVFEALVDDLAAAVRHIRHRWAGG